MKRWIIPCLSLLLIAPLILVSSPTYGSKEVVKSPVHRVGHPADFPATLDEGAKTIPAIFGRMDDQEKKSQDDSHLILLLKNVREALNGWLKSINERIESEDVTKIEVRFLEMLRSILEWVKEKIDAKIESSQPQKRQTEWARFFRA
jgi:hypothetical protein